jgi:hypothetical protein
LAAVDVVGPLVQLPDEIAALPSRVLPGSIRHFLETTHPAASAWLDHRLGSIMPVRNAAALDRHDLALSSDGWLKEPPRRTRLVPERELSLGENGLKRLRATREEELASLQLQLTSLRRSRDDWNAWIQRGRDNHLNDFSVPSNAGDLRNLDDLIAEEDSLRETLDLLATPEREAAVKRMRDLESAERSASERAIRMDERIARADLESAQLRDDLTAREEAERSLAISREASRARLPVSATAAQACCSETRSPSTARRASRTSIGRDDQSIASSSGCGAMTIRAGRFCAAR